MVDKLSVTVTDSGEAQMAGERSGSIVGEMLWLLLGGAAALAALGLAVPYPVSPYLHWGARLGLSAVLGLAAAWDWRTASVPTWITLPLMALGVVWLGWRWHAGTLPADALWIAGAGWALCLWALRLEAFGEGDVKLAMALLALFPDMRFVWLVLVVLLAGSWLALSLLRGRAGWRRFLGLLARAAMTAQLPTPEENRAAVDAPGGVHRSAWMFSLAAIAFMWLTA